jgi:hypothetical protein
VLDAYLAAAPGVEGSASATEGTGALGSSGVDEEPSSRGAPASSSQLPAESTENGDAGPVEQVTDMLSEYSSESLLIPGVVAAVLVLLVASVAVARRRWNG